MAGGHIGGKAEWLDRATIPSMRPLIPMTGRSYAPLWGIAVGVALGLTTSVADHVVGWLGQDVLARGDRSAVGQIADFVSLILDSGWAWAAAAVLAGWLSCRLGGRLRTAAISGPLALIVGTLLFYGWRQELETSTTRHWLAASVIFGPFLGVIGGLTRRPGWIGALAGLVVPAGAVFNIVWRPVDPNSPLAFPITVLIVSASSVAAAAVLFRAARLRRRPSFGFGQTSD
jgi:hypothetical protein